MEINPAFASPCGLYCGVCAIYIAHRDNNQKFKKRLATLYRGGLPARARFPTAKAFQRRASAVAGACPTIGS